MSITAFVTKFGASGNNLKVEVEFKDNSNNTGIGPVTIDLPLSSVSTKEDVKTLFPSALSTFCTNNSVDQPASTVWLCEPALSGLTNAPQAAISDAPADAVTNYNVVTTLLGALTGAVNTANTKQNDIATKLNALLAELRTLGLISA